MRCVPMLAFSLFLCACGAKTTQTAVDEVEIDPYRDVSEAFAARDYAGAIALSTQRMDSLGESVEGLTYRGVAYAKMNKPYPAFADLITAVSLDYNVTTLMNLGNALRMFGYCARASDAYRQALAISPNDPRVLINLSSSYMCYGDLEMANTFFVKSIENFEKNAVSFTNAAILKNLDGDDEQTRLAAQKAIEYDALYRPAYKVLARACAGLGDRECVDEANRHYQSLTGVQLKQRKPIPVKR